MKTASKLLSIALGMALLAPGLVLAHDGEHEAESPSPRPLISRTSMPKAQFAKVEAGALCTKIDDVTGGMSTETTGRFKRLDDNFSHRADKITADSTGVTTKLVEQRTKADTKRAEYLAKLDGMVTTIDGKKAAEAFKAAVTAAVVKRRAAVDAANTAFKQAMLAAVKQRQTQLRAAAVTYQAAVASAVSRAKTSCAAGARPEVVRTQLQTSLKTARQSLEIARKNAEKVGNQDVLKTARKTAIEAANTEFKASLKAALAVLKAALPSSN